MRLTPGYLTAVATFYDMFETEPKGDVYVYVCTNISCSLRGADKIYEAMVAAGGDDPAVNVRSFECLGACDIAPMASVGGEYVGPAGRGGLRADRRRTSKRAARCSRQSSCASSRRPR
jgi:NADH:ubiquinone oxidoreductase subunit E